MLPSPPPPCDTFSWISPIKVICIINKNNREMTMKCSFSYDPFYRFAFKKMWEPQYDHVISQSL